MWATPHGLRDLDLADGPRALRRQLVSETAAAGLAPASADDLIVAAGEIFANAHRHAGGAARVRVGLADAHLVCEISDHGCGIADPLAGFLPPGDPPAQGCGAPAG